MNFSGAWLREESTRYLNTLFSYVWGDPTCAGYLFCQNDHPTDAGGNSCPDHAANIIDFIRTLPLSRSLNDALRKIRRSLSHLGHVVTVWADAICIDQSNLERAQQVRLMNKIYKSASSIWVWLGPDEFQDAEGVFRYIEKRVEQLQVSHGDNLFESGPEPALCKRPEYLEDYNKKIWLGIARLFERPYWTRVWVLQKLGVARQATMY